MARVECLICGVKYEHPASKFCTVCGSAEYTTDYECADFEFDNDGEYPEDDSLDDPDYEWNEENYDESNPDESSEW